MQLPTWLRFVTVLVALNAVVVSWSVIQHHVIASTSQQESSETVTKQVGLADAATVARQEQPSEIPLPPPGVLEVSQATVPQDDPLLKEIQKQAASQFGALPQLDAIETKHSAGENSSTVSVGRSATDFQILQRRLQAVSGLNEAAIRLSQMATLEQQLGQHERADVWLGKIDRIMELMRELLSE